MSDCRPTCEECGAAKCQPRLDRLDKAMFGNGHPEDALLTRVFIIEERLKRNTKLTGAVFGAILPVALKAIWDFVRGS